MATRFATRWLRGTVAATLLLWLPYLVFLKHNSYPLARPEILLTAALMALAGAGWGAVMAAGGTAARVAVVTALAVLVVDVQTDWITTVGLRLLLTILVLGTAAWFLRRRLERAVILLVGVMILGTAVAPGRPLVRRTGPAPDPEAARADLPFVLHLILDEHVGPEGIPREFDPRREIADRVRQDYLDLGFRVFGRAYSRYYYTSDSIGNVLNFAADPERARFFGGRFAEGDLLAENAWIRLHRERGYRIHVVQNDYMRFHGRTAAGEELADGALTIPAEAVGALDGWEIPAGEKARFIMASYHRLSYFLGGMRRGYAAVRRSGPGRAAALPDWDVAGDRLSILTAMRALTELEAELEHAGPGQAFLVHLLLPHYPYAFRADCSLRPLSAGWLDAADPEFRPLRNDRETRRPRYRQYLEQLLCSHGRIRELLADLATRPWWDDAVVVVHGDHGSRIDRGPAATPHVDELSPRDLVDGHAALFAVKAPAAPPGYDRRVLPLDHLVARIVRDGSDPGDAELEAAPRILVRDGYRPMREHPLPLFSHGELAPGPPPGP